MLRSFVLIAIVVLPLAAREQGLQSPSSQQAGAQQPAARPSAAVKGHVYAAESGLPLRRAQVRITSVDNSGPGENRLVATDANGGYEFIDLPSGRYTLTASKGSYVTINYGQTRPFEPGHTIELADAQLLERIDFALPRGGVITGRIVDEFGEPVSRVTVSALRAGTRGRATTRTTTTDDLGEYRLYGLSPSEYLVEATAQLPVGNALATDTADAHDGYATTFFPGVIDAKDAQRITLGIGQIAEDVSFTIQRTRTARVTGSVTDSKGRPFSGMLMVMRMSNGNMSGNGWPIRPDGTFVLANVAPGQYTLEASRFGDDEPEVATLRLTVAGQDISDVRIVTAPYVTARGRIVADAALLQQFPIAGISITVIPASPDDMFPGPVRPARVGDDLAFEIKSPPGRMRIRLIGQPTGLDVRAVRVSGVDKTDEGIDFEPGALVRDIDLELTNRVTSVSGMVTNARGEAARDYIAVLFARDPARWKMGNRYVKIGRPDQEARFRVTGLPPGDYYAVALEGIESGRWYDEEFLERAHRDSTTFTLMEGEAKTLDLKLQTAR
jgi:protocatechuate 3,4-dioxygenase beta subunit